MGTEVLATRGSEGTLLLVASPPGLSPIGAVLATKNALGVLGKEYFTHSAGTCGLSTLSAPEDFARAYREAREVYLCLAGAQSEAPSGLRILAADDLGPARLFIANTPGPAVERYAKEILGGLLDGESSSQELLSTLETFLSAGRSIRASAAALGLHENTVRLRLERIQRATGLDVAHDSNHQLSAQTALLILRLQGHPSLPPFGP